MKKKILLLILGSSVLAGCTIQTQERSDDKTSGSKLTFYSDREKQDQSLSQDKSAQARETALTKENTTSNNLTNKKMYPTPPEMIINKNKTYIATLKTDVGNIVIALDAKKTPLTVNNFVFLAREKFYDGTSFHRVIDDFMIQGGDPTGTGMGGPGYKFNDEKFVGTYTRGTLAMANAGPNTNGSQFFIMHQDSQLPPSYVIFGHVLSGLDVVDTIATAKTKPGGEGSSPIMPVVVHTIEITENK